MSKFVKIATKYEDHNYEKPMNILEGEVIFEYYSSFGFPAVVLEVEGILLQLPLENIQEVLIAGNWLPINFFDSKKW
jgi:hypothetical protein